MTSLLLGSESDTSSSDSEKQSPVKKKRRRGGDIDGLKINEDYAKAYNHFREKEVLQRLKDKYGDDYGDDGSSSTSDEEEDDHAEGLTEDVERDFFKTLACLKQKDPRVYDSGTTFFSKKEDSEKPRKKKTAATKALRLKDFESKIMLEKQGQYEEMEDDTTSRNGTGRTYVQEMADIKKSFMKVAHDDSDDSDDGLLKQKIMSKEEKEKDEADYKTWLAGKAEDVDDEEAKKEMKGLRDFWNRPDLDDGEKFLKDYILNRRYLEDEDMDEEGSDAEALSEDENTLQKMEEFEHKYNFRFEEPDQEFIKRYPRTVKDSMRREETKRKRKREEVQERRRAEKEKKKEELRQLKALKKKEIMDKLEKLKRVSGTKELDFMEEDIEGDFDPTQHDKRMSELFAKYDQVHVENEEERPEVSDPESDLEVDNWDQWDGAGADQDEQDTQAYEADIVMDCDYDDSVKNQAQEEILESVRGRKQRRKSRFAQLVEKKKPAFDPQVDRSYQDYLNEYYKLDYEDLIGDLPCRFKYRDVKANDFGLSVNEVLSAPDRELNAWCSLKKTCQYRTDEEEVHDLKLFQNRGKNVSLKQKILPSLFTDNPDLELQAEKERRSEKSKKRRKKKGKSSGEEIPIADGDGQDAGVEPSGNKKRKKKCKKKKKPGASEIDAGNQSQNSAVKVRGKNKKVKADVNAEIKMSDDRLKAYGLKPNQLKRKIKKQKYKASSGTRNIASGV